MTNPKCVLLLSGKRKCGKDFVAERILKRLDPESAVIIRLSDPIKSHWALSKGLELDQLRGTSEYKEKYRKDMTKWGEEKRLVDSGCFCRAAIEMSKAEEKSVWIISDARRMTDLQWFQSHHGGVLQTVRIIANDSARIERGWIFTEGIDDAETECGLDSVTNWDWTIENNGSENDLDDKINLILNQINNQVSS